MVLLVFGDFQIRKRGGRQGIPPIGRSPKLKYMQEEE
jgi:hypothetical protein